MRIRKNAKLGGSVSIEKLQPLVCQLNQSPWDVIPFGSDLIQFGYEEDDSFGGNANGSAGNYSGRAVESVASPTMDTELNSPPNIQNVVVPDNDDMSEQNGIVNVVVPDNDDMSEQNGIVQLDHKADEENETTSCGQYKHNEAKKQGHSIYEHDKLSSRRSKKAVGLAGARRTRAQNSKKPPSGTSNPDEFYYYSGFGPQWGNRRGGRNGGLNNKNEVKRKVSGEDSTITEANGATIQSHCSSSQIDTGGFDYAYDDDDEVEGDYDDEVEEGNNGESGKKRMRKPVKARSLKSLM